MEKIHDGTWKMKGGDRWRVVVRADSDKIVKRLLGRALKNKNGKATALGGGIVVETQTDTSH